MRASRELHLTESLFQSIIIGMTRKNLPALTLEDEYRSKVAPELGYMCNMLRWGASFEKIADRLGIEPARLVEMSKSIPEMGEPVKSALMQRDEDIQRVFFEASVGGFKTLKTIERIRKEDGSMQIKVQEKQAYIAPDARLLKLLLENTDKWFVDSDEFQKRITEESLKVRQKLAGKNDWKGVEIKGSKTQRKRRMV